MKKRGMSARLGADSSGLSRRAEGLPESRAVPLATAGALRLRALAGRDRRGVLGAEGVVAGRCGRPVLGLGEAGARGQKRRLSGRRARDAELSGRSAWDNVLLPPLAGG